MKYQRKKEVFLYKKDFFFILLHPYTSLFLASQ